MNAIVVYDDKRDRELLELVDSKFPVFISCIDYNTTYGRKEANKVKSYWAAKANPFVVVEEENHIVKIFYSDNGDNAIQQLINWLNGN